VTAFQQDFSRAAAMNVCISYPKSGRTWLRMILADLQVAMAFTHLDTGADKKSWGKRFDALETPHSDAARTVFLHRDPRDVVVSLFHEMTKRQAGKLSVKAAADLAERGLAPPQEMDGFVRSPNFGIEKTIVFNLACAVHLKAHVVSYEALRANPAAELAPLLAYVDAAPAPAALTAAIEANSFAAMRRREQSGDIPAHMAGRLGAANPADPNSYKVRRGVVGGWRDEMGSETAAYAEALLARYDYFARMDAAFRRS